MCFNMVVGGIPMYEFPWSALPDLPTHHIETLSYPSSHSRNPAQPYGRSMPFGVGPENASIWCPVGGLEPTVKGSRTLRSGLSRYLPTTRPRMPNSGTKDIAAPYWNTLWESNPTGHSITLRPATPGPWRLNALQYGSEVLTLRRRNIPSRSREGVHFNGHPLYIGILWSRW